MGKRDTERYAREREKILLLNNKTAFGLNPKDKSSDMYRSTPLRHPHQEQQLNVNASFHIERKAVSRKEEEEEEDRFCFLSQEEGRHFFIRVTKTFA